MKIKIINNSNIKNYYTTISLFKIPSYYILIINFKFKFVAKFIQMRLYWQIFYKLILFEKNF